VNVLNNNIYIHLQSSKRFSDEEKAFLLQVEDEAAVGRESCTDVLDDESIARDVTHAEGSTLYRRAHLLLGAERELPFCHWNQRAFSGESIARYVMNDGIGG
jgi:hypothetical protein